MAGIVKGVLSFLGITAEDQNNAQLVLFNLSSVDAGPTDTGATALGTSAANAYQIVAANTWFSAGALGAGCNLPETSAMPGGFQQGLRGLNVYIANTGANYVNVYPHPNDVGGTINLGASVTLQPNSITVFQCFPPGMWLADGIGAGFAGSIETIAPQNATGSTTHSQVGGTPVNQGLVIMTTSNASDAYTLPPAKPGMTITMVNTSATNAPTVYPASQTQGGVTGGDTINSLGQNNVFSSMTAQGGALPVCIFTCGVAGQWWTK